MVDEHPGQQRPGDILITPIRDGGPFLIARLLDPALGHGERESLGTSRTEGEAMVKACEERGGCTAWIGDSTAYSAVICREVRYRVTEGGTMFTFTSDGSGLRLGGVPWDVATWSGSIAMLKELQRSNASVRFVEEDGTRR